MSNQTVEQAEPQGNAVHDALPTWKQLIEDLEGPEDRFSGAIADLTELLDRFDWEDDVPEAVQEAVQDAGTAIYTAAFDVGRELGKLREAAASVTNDTTDNE